MYIYLLVLLAICLIFSATKNKKRALFISFILITIIAGLRKYTVGVDTKQFYIMYTMIGEASSWNYQIYRFEAAFFYLCKILYFISENPQLLIAFTSIFINVSVYKFIKKNSSNYFLSIILYVIMNIFFSYMNIMRQALAIAVLLYGFELLKDKKYIKYCGIILIASLFHSAAWAALLLVIYRALPNRNWIYYLTVLGAILLFFEYDKFFDILTSVFGYAGYANTEFGASNYFGALIGFLEAFIIIGINYLYIIINKRKEFLRSDKMHVLNIATVIYLFFMLLVMRMNIFNRISGLYSIYAIITIPELFGEIKKLNVGDYRIFNLITIGAYVLSFIVIGYYRPEWYGCIPYEFFWK